MRDPATAEKPLVVRYVYPGSPAEKAGLAAGDVVTQINDAKIADRAAAFEKLMKFSKIEYR